MDYNYRPIVSSFGSSMGSFFDSKIRFRPLAHTYNWDTPNSNNFASGKDAKKFTGVLFPSSCLNVSLLRNRVR